jgi:hypothetical protein
MFIVICMTFLLKYISFKKWLEKGVFYNSALLLCVICDESKIDKRGCNGAPNLVVEIISPGNSKHDVHAKFDLCQEAGVKGYWMVGPTERMILFYTLKEDEYVGLKPFIE